MCSSEVGVLVYVDMRTRFDLYIHMGKLLFNIAKEPTMVFICHFEYLIVMFK